MKSRYHNITVPYLYFDKKRNKTYYIYKDKEYIYLNDLTKAFIDFELTYHFETDGKLKEVHNFDDVIEGLLNNYRDFHIARKYLSEYSENELNYLHKLNNALLKDRLKLNYDYSKMPATFKPSEKKYQKAYYEAMRKYANVIKPRKVTIATYNEKFYVVGGIIQENIISALDQVFDYSLYYEYGGKPRSTSNASFHEHDFKSIISSIFSNYNNFKLYKHQYDCYSKQEIFLITEILDKLKKMNYKVVSRNYSNLDYEEYFYLKDNHKYFSLLLFNIKDYFKDKEYEKERLEAHKIKE